MKIFRILALWALIVEAAGALPRPLPPAAASLGVHAAADGSLRYGKRPLSAREAERVRRFLERAPRKDPERFLAEALENFLELRPSTASAAFLRDGALTPLGKNALMDILTAEDGRLLDVGLSSGTAALKNIRELSFDGRFVLRDFDWGNFPVSEGLRVDSGGNRVRLLIETQRNVKRDRFSMSPRSKQGSVYREAGLDGKLLKRNKAQVIRAFDNLVVVDVPAPRAAALAKVLGRRGVRSAPAKVFELFDMLRPHLPFVPSELSPYNFDSRRVLNVEALAREGMDGEGVLVGIIDSGIDADHPDFKGRIEAYKDFTGEGLKDTLGHGTFVAGTIGASGAASGGKYRGMAPKVRFMVAKVFGDGSASEDTILAALKWMQSAKRKPDIINMSFGNPDSGEPNGDIVGSMANRMMVQEGILMVAAAGNHGPEPETIPSPANARYVIAVTGINKEGRFPDFVSRGPVRSSSGDSYAKPDLATVAGDVNPAALLSSSVEAAVPVSTSCRYSPGVISTRSADDPDEGCALAGNPYYRFMTGSSVGAPAAAGIKALGIGYGLKNGARPSSSEVAAWGIETASDLGQPRETQGAGLIDGAALAKTIVSRLRLGLPIGNIAYRLAMRLSSEDLRLLDRQERYRNTPLGLLDVETGHLIRDDAQMQRVLEQIRHKPDPPKA